MRIGINGRFLVARRTGVQRAAYNLLKTLIEIDRVNEYVIFTGDDQIANPDWIHPNVKVVTSPLRSGESLRNHFWEQFTLPRLARQHGVDILHSPANMAPLFYKGPSVVHIHDLCFVVNPQWYSFSFRTLYKLLIPRLARRAAKVTTNSNNSRNDLMQFCGITADRVSLVYWAVDDFFLSTNPLPDTAASDPLLNEEYILYVGSLEPRKNIRRLIEAYEILRREHPEHRPKLVLIGGEFPLFAESRWTIKDFADDIIFKGFVDDTTLREFYRHARVVAYPSLYEGFGLPPLEAMANGAPVVTTATSSIPEVVGEAAILVNPHDEKQLAQALRRVLRDETLRKDLIARGLKQVRRFNWYRVARDTLTVYYEVFHSARTGGRRTSIPFDRWKELRHLEESHLNVVTTPVLCERNSP
jgi:glycosyltransferase involved in cell wall biosynthesis